MCSPIASYPKSGIRVVIVGAGFGGLTAAIECQRKGHDVVLLERNTEWKQLGDIISLASNAGSILYRWDRKLVHDKLKRVCMSNNRFQIFGHKGDKIVEQVFSHPEGKPGYSGHRAEIHRVLLDYAVSLNIPILMGKKVVEWRDDEKSAWVVLDNGEIIRGDLVVAANGLRSKAKNAVLGSHSSGEASDEEIQRLCREKSSGYAIYRAWYNGQEAGIADDPLTRVFAEREAHMGWLGQDVHFLVASIKEPRQISWVATHKITKTFDLNDESEDWMNPLPAKVQEALTLFDGWDPTCKAIVSKTASCIDFPLIIRDPLPTWLSANKRICLLGDSAHPFLPTSIQGASQAIEDGIVLATVLSLSKFSSAIPANKKVQAALEAYQRLRYERVNTAQKQGVDVMEKWHRTDWEDVRRNPGKMKLPVQDWLLMHDSERWTRGIWDDWVEEYLGRARLPRHRLACGKESSEILYS